MIAQIMEKGNVVMQSAQSGTYRLQDPSIHLKDIGMNLIDKFKN